MAKADLEKARELFPSCAMGMGDWQQFFASAAGLKSLGRIIYDVYDEIKSVEEREAGKRRIGRRPAREAVSLAEVMAVVRPDEFSNEPLHVALRALMRGRTQRAFAKKVPISQPYLNRLLAGGVHERLTMELLESLADAANVHPWHFREWRALYLGELVTETLRESPHLGIAVLRDLRGRRQKYESTLAPTRYTSTGITQKDRR